MDLICIRPEINAAERVCRTQRIQPPDSVLSDIGSLAFGRSHLFGEVNPETTTDRLNAIDLLRLSGFAKDAIDLSRARQIVTFQADGKLRNETAEQETTDTILANHLSEVLFTCFNLGPIVTLYISRLKIYILFDVED